MTERDERPETVVFDAEPLISYFCDEPGSDTVETYIDAVEGAAVGYISAVNLAEVHHIVRAIDGEARADAVVDVLAESGLRRVDTEERGRPPPISSTDTRRLSATRSRWRRPPRWMARSSPVPTTITTTLPR